MTLTVNDSSIVLIKDTRTVITHQFIKKNRAGKLWYLVFLHDWFSHCWSRKTKDLVLSDDDFMDLIYSVVDLIIGDAPFDISTIKGGSKLIIRHGKIHAKQNTLWPREKKTHTMWLENENLRKKIATSLEKFNSLKDKPTELNEALLKPNKENSNVTEEQKKEKGQRRRNCLPCA